MRLVDANRLRFIGGTFPSDLNTKRENHTLFQSASFVIGVLDAQSLDRKASIGTKLEIVTAWKQGRLLAVILDGFVCQPDMSAKLINGWTELPEWEEYLEDDEKGADPETLFRTGFNCEMCEIGVYADTEIADYCDFSERHKFPCGGQLVHYLPEGLNSDHYIVCSDYISDLYDRTCSYCGDDYKGGRCTADRCYQQEEWDRYLDEDFDLM
jgi:hypothetical protein